MKQLVTLLILCIPLTQCGTSAPHGHPSEGQRMRYVSVPLDLNERERQYVNAVIDTLEAYGFMPTRGGGADYSLDFSIEEGPINTDTTLNLYRRGSTVARGQGRDGGPQSIFNRAGVVRRSFDDALSEFTDELDDMDDGYLERDRNDYQGEHGRGYPTYPTY